MYKNDCRMKQTKKKKKALRNKQEELMEREGKGDESNEE